MLGHCQGHVEDVDEAHRGLEHALALDLVGHVGFALERGLDVALHPGS